MVDVDALGLDAERLEAVALSGEILGVGGDAGVADLELGHAAKWLLSAMGVPVGVPWVLAVIATPPQSELLSSSSCCV